MSILQQFNDHCLMHNAPQGSKEWLNARNGRITGTRISVLMNHNRFKNIEQLIREVNGEQPVINEAMTWGNEHEPIARKWYIENTGNEVTEHGLAVSINNNNFAASIDGYIESENTILEIKCPQRMYRSFANYHEIYDNHYDQVQWNMGILGSEYCDYLLWTEQQQVYTTVSFDQQYFNTMIDAAEQFYKQYCDQIN